MPFPATLSRPAGLAVAFALTGAGFGAFAFAAHGDDERRKDETFLTAETVGVTNVEGGDCFSDPAYDETQRTDIVEHQGCEAADNQAYGFFQLDDASFDTAEVARKGWDGCRAGFTSYWEDENASGLAFYPVLPTATSWADYDDRTVMCVVYNPRGQLEGSPLPTS
jgi:hypothetical protein